MTDEEPFYYKDFKDTFPFSDFCMTKSTKSQQGGLTPSSFRTTGGVHESVARAMRGKCVRHWLLLQVSSFALTTTSTIPRVRTYHTREPSRFVHALSARPLKVRELTDLRSMCVGVAETG